MKIPKFLKVIGLGIVIIVLTGLGFFVSALLINTGTKLVGPDTFFIIMVSGFIVLCMVIAYHIVE